MESDKRLAILHGMDIAFVYTGKYTLGGVT